MKRSKDLSEPSLPDPISSYLCIVSVLIYCCIISTWINTEQVLKRHCKFSGKTSDTHAEQLFGYCLQDYHKNAFWDIWPRLKHCTNVYKTLPIHFITTVFGAGTAKYLNAAVPIK